MCRALKLWALIEEARDRLEHVDYALDYAVRQARDIFSVQLKTSESFLHLLWPPCPEALWLTPEGQSRTVKDVAGRILNSGHSFEQLAEGHRKLPDDHDTEFFAKFPYLDENFDMQKFGLLALAALGEEEQSESPRANFYLYDGVRRSLVLAKRLLTGQSRYEPVNALLIIPRPL